MAKCVDPGQLASSEANWCGSTLFAKAGYAQDQQDQRYYQHVGRIWLKFLMECQTLSSGKKDSLNSVKPYFSRNTKTCIIFVSFTDLSMQKAKLIS